MRHFYVDGSAMDGRDAVLTGSDARHIKSVLRLNPGDVIGLYDGSGTEYRARIRGTHRNRIDVSILSTHPTEAESPARITVAQALLKNRKMDGLIRQLTELGIAEWIPVSADRSVPRPDEGRLASRMGRWQVIAQEAIKQCRRGRIMEIHPPVPIGNVIRQKIPYDLKVIFYEGRTDPLQAERHPSGKRVRTILAVMGPEGGFTREEIDQATANGFVVAGLGPRILKAETATVAACTLLQHLFGDMG
jgi:16S rRNA (uracil1498-N3)-methyltransferase